VALLKVTGLTKLFGGVHAVRDLSFELNAGEMLAMIGPNGAGKSTCFNMLNGQLTPDGGDIVLEGHSIAGRSPRDIWRRGVGRTFQVAATFASMTVVENVQLALLSKKRRVGALWRPMRDQARREALRLLERAGVAALAERACGALAYGDVKKIELALAIAHDPKLLLMDEPTAGMAPQERHEVMAVVRELSRERAMAVLFTEHSMDVVFAHAHRIIVMARGSVIASGTPQAVREDPQVQRVYLGGGLMLGDKRTAAHGSRVL
jgi:branched-chain amino acid transport system ATP-binding protein